MMSNIEDHSKDEQNATDRGLMKESVVVTMPELFGTIFLGILSLILLVALLREQARYRELLQRVDRV